MEHAARGEPPVACEARRILVGGRVQGVGFRPFVYRLAVGLGLAGQVRNLSGQVVIEVEGRAKAIDDFIARLVEGPPPLARPVLLAVEAIACRGHGAFVVGRSDADGPLDVHVPPDHFLCDDCRRELYDPRDRRYRYPFLNCTQCGPRYTLMRRLPYDRPNTAMADFPLCRACHAEYTDPLDRRFHAEPIACAACGPSLSFHARGHTVTGNEAALAACLDALRAGAIVAVKGVGGYHLLCDAASDAAVARLRARKRRPHKPLALLFPWRGADGLDAVRAHLELDAAKAAALLSPTRPIVLLRRGATARLSAHIAPGLGEVGAMLPYSPLHELLADGFAAPLVATSGNVSGEPVLTDNTEAQIRLAPVADAWLNHDRPILRPADDSVVRVIGGVPRWLRVGRGAAPLELEAPRAFAVPTLAVGGHMKNTVALGWEQRMVVSPHIGDLSAPRSRDVFEQVVADLQQLYGVRVQRIVCDAHPDYASSRWAARQGLPLTRVWHHHAHASALAGEHGQIKDWLVFTWDGVGLGEDGTLWGGEALHGRPGAWRRVGRLRPFRLPGSEKVAREPWRAAAGTCWEAGLAWHGQEEHPVLRQAWQRGLNAPYTSAAGRLFDAAASLLGLIDRASFEGQGPMLLEAAAGGAAEAVSLPMSRTDGLWELDWAPLIARLNAETDVATAAMRFHVSLAQALVEQARAVRADHAFDAVGLAGGVFQNKLLTELAQAGLESAGFRVYLAGALPCNDGALAFGQLIESLSVT